MARTLTIRIVKDDIRQVGADVVALKYAQGYYGADLVVARALEGYGVDTSGFQAAVGEYRLADSGGAIAAPRVLLVGVPTLRNFRYERIRRFAADTLRILAKEAPTTRHLAMTIHGPGYGLDEVESLLSQFGGYLDALREGSAPKSLERLPRFMSFWAA
jgi:hypothetical protein